MVSAFISPALIAVLVLIGVLHLAWALGIYFPCANEQELARTVVGRRGITKMPSSKAMAFVAFCLFFAAYWAALLGGHLHLPFGEQVSKLLMAGVGGVIGLVFLGRGIIGVLPAFERAAPEMPFLELNRRVYSPLSFILGIGFILMVLALPNWSWRLGLG